MDQFQHAAGCVDRILKGENLAELPVQASIKLELVIYVSSPGVGLAVPPTPIARADEVIE